MASWAQKSHRTPVEAASTSLVRISGGIGFKSWWNETNFGTVAFEETILTILPSVIFILATCPRIFYLLRSKDQTSRQSTYTPKLVSATNGSKTMLCFTNMSGDRLPVAYTYLYKLPNWPSSPRPTRSTQSSPLQLPPLT